MCFVGAALRQSGRQWDDTFCPPARLLYHFWGGSLRKYRKKFRDLSQVMECGWATLQRQIQRAESLDEMVEAHHQFLDTLIARLVCINYQFMVGCWVDFLSQGWLDPGHVMEMLNLNPTQGSAWWAITGASDPVAGYLWQVIENWKFEWILQLIVY